MNASFTRRRILTHGGASALFGTVPALHAQAADAFPEKNFKLIVPLPAGGSADVHSRKVAALVERQIKRTIVVDNRAGASGLIGLQAFLKEPADGSALLMVVPQLITSLAIRGGVKMLEGLEPVTLFTASPSVVLVPGNSPYKTLRDFISAARAKPDAMAFSSAGMGSSAHMSMELLMQKTGIRLRHIPYKSAPEQLPGLVAGEVDVAIPVASTMLGPISDGSVRALGTTFPERLPALQDVPTVAEAGVPGYEYSVWTAYAVRKGTPKALVDRWFEELQVAFTNQDLREYVGRSGAYIRSNRNPAECASFMAAEIRHAIEIAARLDPSKKS